MYGARLWITAMKMSGTPLEDRTCSQKFKCGKEIPTPLDSNWLTLYLMMNLSWAGLKRKRICLASIMRLMTTRKSSWQLNFKSYGYVPTRQHRTQYMLTSEVSPSKNMEVILIKDYSQVAHTNSRAYSIWQDRDWLALEWSSQTSGKTSKISEQFAQFWTHQIVQILNSCYQTSGVWMLRLEQDMIPRLSAMTRWASFTSSKMAIHSVVTGLWSCPMLHHTSVLVTLKNLQS